MSLKVLVIPEDPTHNGYILKPLVEAILADAGRPAAKVSVLVNPRLQGYDHALEAIRGDLLEKYGFWDLWIFIPDADRASDSAMRKLESELAREGVTLFCSPAVPEVEIYACVAFRSEIRGGWNEARADSSFKENVFGELLAEHGDPRRAGQGRDLMIGESLKNLPLLFKHCPELKALRDRLFKHLKS